MSTTPQTTPVTVRTELNPFAATPFIEKLTKCNSWWFLLVLPLLWGSMLLASGVEGTSGSGADLQFWIDIQRAFGATGVSGSAPDFPLFRDASSWFFAIVDALTCVLVHRQWQLMRRCLPELLDSGAVRRKDTPTYGRIHKLLLIPRLVGTGSADPLHKLMERANNGLARVGRFQIVVAALSVLLAGLALIGENHNGLFRVFAPTGLRQQELQDWLRQAYSSWWASIDHPTGLIVYMFVATLGIFVILLQNIVGFFCMYLIVALSAVVDFDADWLNRDGSFGWRSLARAFRTLYWSLALHGSALSMILMILGLANFSWIFGLVLIWVIVMPTYTIVPIMAFRKVRQSARDTKIREVDARRIKAGIAADDIVGIEVYRAAIDRVNAAVIRPMRIKSRRLPAFLIAVMLPVALTVIQIFFS
jgi:hypothetical protein